MVVERRNRFYFPRLERVVIEQFSLYQNAPVIDVVLDDGVFCLAGANGLGKSTFLAAVNYGLTGRVARPARLVKSASEFYSESIRTTREFFSGRIRESDREAAQISLWFSVGTTQFHLVRSMFEIDQLRTLTISGPDEHARRDHLEGGESLHDIYTAEMARATGILDFKQFVFLQLFLLTFDERRDLLFWNELTTEQVLYLAFGVDPSVAPRAEELRRLDERLESQARNQQYRATQAAQLMRKLRATTGAGEDVDTDLRAEFASLQRQRDEVATAVATAEAEVEDAKINLAANIARRTSAIDDFEGQFASLMGAARDPQHHPVVVQSRVGDRCELCGVSGIHVQEALDRAAAASICPLCQSSVEPEPAGRPDQLVHLSTVVVSARAAVESATDRVTRQAAEVHTLKRQLEDIERTIEQMEQDVGPAIHGVDELAAARLRQLEDERSAATRRRDEYRLERNSARSELRTLRATLSQQYAIAELEFVPLFKRLAAEFLGLDIDIQMKSKAESLGFILSVEGEPRRVTDALSESQRFFVDIALRMALAKFMSADGGRATMFIDTPEGSLDIAYEAQAGEMFASFVLDGYHIIMTANINTSQLLLELAQRCRRQRMTLHRMTEWAVLSVVQQRSEGLFDRAYGAIEAALDGPGS